MGSVHGAATDICIKSENKGLLGQYRATRIISASFFLAMLIRRMVMKASSSPFGQGCNSTFSTSAPRSLNLARYDFVVVL